MPITSFRMTFYCGHIAYNINSVDDELSSFCVYFALEYNIKFDVIASDLDTVELQWLEHLWDHGKVFEP